GRRSPHREPRRLPVPSPSRRGLSGGRELSGSDGPLGRIRHAHRAAAHRRHRLALRRDARRLEAVRGATNASGRHLEPMPHSVGPTVRTRRFQMRAMLWLSGTVPLLAVMACATAGPPPPPAVAAPTVPVEIQAPADTVPVAKLAARGTQNYRCEPTDTGSVWKLVAPEADLTDPSTPGATVVVKHGAGPSWNHPDGSGLVGDGKSAKR